MSTTTAKRFLNEARRDAEAFRGLFASECYERWEFAGSVRRCARQIGDVEHVIIARTVEMKDSDDLFATPKPVNLLLARLDELMSTYVVTKHAYGTDEHGQPKHRWGQKYRGVDFRGFCHEVFCADVDNWGPTLAIRTGPGTFSKMLVTRLQRQGYINDAGYVWNKNEMACSYCGWRGAFAGLMFYEAADVVRMGLPVGQKPKWLNGDDHAGVCPSCGRETTLSMARVSVPDERQYFELCGVKWAEPADRQEVSQ
jgi:DNA polymerase/3'-5' exonuclease PolX